jgi:hypothetical protein
MLRNHKKGVFENDSQEFEVEGLSLDDPQHANSYSNALRCFYFPHMLS